MAKKEKPVADDSTGKIKVKAKKEKQPDNNETKGNVTKVKKKMKMKPIIEKETVTKVDLDKPTKPEENEVKENNTNNEGVVTELKNADAPQEQKEVQPETKTQETPVLEEVKKEDNIETKTEEIAIKAEKAIKENLETGKPLPENIQKLVNFMEETGGDLNDYVKLNQDYSKLDNQELLFEYYKNTKPHLNAEEINFLMDDQFLYDEDTDEEKSIKRKKLALKEQVADARAYLDRQKSKYYEDIKSGSKLTKEQQEAIDFFNNYKAEEEENERGSQLRKSTFESETEQVFNNEFKGFEYNIGDKRFRFNVNNADEVKNKQSDISNFIGKFLDENQTMKDAAGYHKSIFTAMNADAIANHFYEQGKADAIKQSVEVGKNIDMNPRQAHGEVSAGGIKVRVLGEDSSDFKFKIRNKNK